jgi:cell division inhibitor SepF
MASMLRRAMHLLGLDPDDEYYDEYESDPTAGGPARSYAPPEPPEPPNPAVRPIPRDAEQSGPTPIARSRPAVVRPITTPMASSPKPFVAAPTSFTEAQSVADKFMAGVPVFMNLQDVERELSRRLVDFASGLCYGLRGSMERVTNQVYLLTPSNVEVSAEEKRRLRESD